MPRECDITVENNLVTEKRALNVYHHTLPTGSSHIISHGNSVTFPLKSGEENEYLHVSVIRGPGDLRENCSLNLPSWLDFEFSTGGKVMVAHSGGRTKLNIPPGPPDWQLKIKQPPAAHDAAAKDVIIISDL
jgi:hypothetical protein